MNRGADPSGQAERIARGSNFDGHSAWWDLGIRHEEGCGSGLAQSGVLGIAHDADNKNGDVAFAAVDEHESSTDGELPLEHFPRHGFVDHCNARGFAGVGCLEAPAGRRRGGG